MSYKNQAPGKMLGFTLIELLVVVAIVAVLAAVGIPMYQGYQTTTKINATKTNHSNIKSFIAAEVTKCQMGGTLTLKNTSGNPENFNCQNGTPTAIDLRNRFSAHFFGDKWMNPYRTSTTATNEGGANSKTGCPYLGSTNIWHVGNDLVIRSNYGNDAGATVCTAEERIATR